MQPLLCCLREREIRRDFDEHESIVMYNGLESIETCIFSSNSSDDNESSTSKTNGCTSDSLDEDNASSFSSKDANGLFCSQLLTNKHEPDVPCVRDVCRSPPFSYAKDKPAGTMQCLEVEYMKELFGKLLLGEDVSGGGRCVSTALALSNAITDLAASVFGEVWKLEPLPEDLKSKWQREMGWLLSPASYMVELVPAKQKASNGCVLEIMTPKARSDVHMNLAALQKLDSILLEILDSMVDMEFWYVESTSTSEGHVKGKKWWIPSPQVPLYGLSSEQRRKLNCHGQYAYQVLKAANSVNQSVLLEIAVPSFIADALPKSVYGHLGKDLCKALSLESCVDEGILRCLQLRTEHDALVIANRLEMAIFTWNHRRVDCTGSVAALSSWHILKGFDKESGKAAVMIDRAAALLQLLKRKFPYLAPTFLNANKIKHNKDVGHAILEAYSRVLGAVAFHVLVRIVDVLREDNLKKPGALLSPSRSECWFGMFEVSPCRSLHTEADGRILEEFL